MGVLSKLLHKFRQLGKVRGALMVVSLLVLLFSLYKIGGVLLDYYQSARLNDDLREMVFKQGSLGREETAITTADTPSAAPQQPEKTIVAAVDAKKAAYEEALKKVQDSVNLFDYENFRSSLHSEFPKLIKMNPDTVGWLKIPATRIDYPVVKAADNEFYLERNLRKQKSKAGTIFLDYRNNKDLSNKNTILYGHNMHDGSMFNNLMLYFKEEYMETDRTIYLSTPGEDTKWEIFSVYVTDQKFNYLQTSFADDKEYKIFLANLKRKSMVSSSISVTPTDNILTLSTCAYDFPDARLVVHAKLIKEVSY